MKPEYTLVFSFEDESLAQMFLSHIDPKTGGRKLYYVDDDGTLKLMEFDFSCCPAKVTVSRSNKPL